VKRAITWLACLTALMLGCSGKRNPRDLLAPREAGTIVVDARLIVGSGFPPIELRTTRSPAEPYNGEEAALIGAKVAIFTGPGDSILYQRISGPHYEPYRVTGSMYYAIRPNTTYYLRVEAADGRIVTAQTTTPDSFHVRDWVLLDDPSLAVRRRLATYADFQESPDSVYIVDSNQLIYQDGLLEARFDRGNAIGFQVGIYSLDNHSPIVIDADFLSDKDLANLARESSSPAFDAPNGFLRLPWFAIFFEGRYRIAIFSMDRNWYDLARSMDFFGNSNVGFGTNAGDNFDRPIFHVNGGIGLFGSAAMDQTGFTILPRP
jgi:hypothetical protein